MDQLLNPNLSDERRLEEMKKYLIASSRDFSCPVTGEILDYRKCHIVEYYLPNANKRRLALISHNGYERTKAHPRFIANNIQVRIIEDIDEIDEV